MKLTKLAIFTYFIDGLVQYFVDPIARIFGPDDNIYPAVGVQPFEGDPWSKRVDGNS